MTKFKKKEFSKTKVLKSVGEYIYEHPVVPISLITLGISSLNYRTNKKRQEEGKKYQEEHLRTVSKLNENIEKNIDALNTVKDALSENSKKLSEREKKPENKPEEKRRPTIILFKRKEKKYSIQDGGYKGRKVEPQKSSVLVGAGVGATVGAGFSLVTTSNPMFSGSKSIALSIGSILGAGVGALAVWLDNITRQSIFNSGLSNKANSYTILKYLEQVYSDNNDEESTTTTTRTKLDNNTTISSTKRTVSRKSNISAVGTLYSIDSDPKKNVVNILLRNNVMALLLYKPTNMELTKCNNVLDKYCSNYKNADYSATELDKNIYLVEVLVVNDTEGGLVKKFIDSGLKVNILTTDRFGIKNR